jgi:hypothetical protein
MPKLPNPPEADYLFIFLKSTERSETIILGNLGIFQSGSAGQNGLGER